jgi:hypothetical protein
MLSFFLILFLTRDIDSIDILNLGWRNGLSVANIGCDMTIIGDLDRNGHLDIVVNSCPTAQVQGMC